MNTAIGKLPDVLALCMINLVSKRTHMFRVIGSLIILLQFVTLPSALAAISLEHYELLDYYDWQEQRGYNPERDEIIEIGEWNRQELEGHWPETDYDYHEWDSDWYYEE
jgi:hypothetical protein